MTSDFIMREIEGLTRMLANTLFHKQPETPALFDEQGNLSEEVFLLHRLTAMVLDKQVNEAENLLFDTIQEQPRPEYLKAAVDFYGLLSQMSDQELGACDFSRQEILEGLEQIRTLCQ